MSAPFLSIENLQTHFQTDEGVVKAVDHVSLQLSEGEVLGVVGESGCGKSVTAMSILRLILSPPGFYAGGAIWFEGKNLLTVSNHEIKKIRGNEIGMVFQDPMTSLNPYLTVERQLTEVLETHKALTYKQSLAKSCEMLERVGISEAGRRIHQYPHQFSGGQRQRIMIAMALLCRPKLLIADEPTTALDVTIQAQILSLLDDLKNEIQMSVLLISHDLGVVAGLADRVAVMYGGKIIESGKVEELFAAPLHPYTQGLLSSVSTFEPIPGAPPHPAFLPPGCHFAPRCNRVVQKCIEKYPDSRGLQEGRTVSCWEAKA